MRTHSTQLPSYEELEAILSTESTRQVCPEKADLHFGNFATIIALLEHFELPTSFFTKDLSFDELKDSHTSQELSDTFSELGELILKNHEDPELRPMLDAAYDYLSEEDAPERSDIIFVFGSKMTFRTEKAIRLYGSKYASKIMISGKGPFYLKDAPSPEAEILGAFALEHGTPPENLILEKESVTVPDNVKRSLNMLEQEKIPHQRIILVNSPFSQRRGWAHFKKFSTPETKLFRVNIDTVSPQFSRNGWYKDEIGTSTIIKEFFGLRMSEILNTG